MFMQVGSTRFNRVLASLSKEDFELVEPHLRPTLLKQRLCVEVAHRPVETIYFPYSGVISIVARTGNKQHEAEAAVIGYEGMTGLPVVLGTELAVFSGFVQVEGDGVCLPADTLRKLMQISSSLRPRLLHYLDVFLMQSAQTALANAKGTVEQRLARWLLMAHDRLPGDDLRLTHEFVALMLGVRRAGVTVALHQLEASGAISTSRGAIAIIDRIALERDAGGFYGIPKRNRELSLSELSSYGPRDPTLARAMPNP